MELQYLYSASAEQLEKTKAFLASSGLDYDESCSFTVNVLDEGEIIATGSLDGNVLKCIAVSSLRQGEGLSATIVTELRKVSFDNGESHLFIFTKPNNIDMFEGLSFYPVAKTQDALLMESIRGGCSAFVSALPKKQGVCGAIVANCNPFTLGHRYLVEQAAKECDWLYLFILSEDKSRFSAHTRFELAKKGVADLENVIVCPTGKYLISAATFPTYFIKDKTHAEDIKCDMDIEVFTSRFAKALNITKRFVGTEPNSPVTNAYNERLKLILPRYGIKLIEIERKAQDLEPISASRVRKLITQGKRNELIPLLPQSTMEYIDKAFFEK